MNKDSVEIILLCYNSGDVLEETIDKLIKVGFKNITILNDGSVDNTSEIATQKHSEIIQVKSTSGFNNAVLRSIFNVKKPYAIITTPYEINANSSFGQYIDDFISFGIEGNFSLLLAERRLKFMGFNQNLFSTIFDLKIKKILKKKFGMFLPEPSFDFVMINKKMCEVIIEKVSGTGAFIYFDIIKELVINKNKMGVYPISNNFRYIFSSNNHSRSLSYFTFAFPDESRKNIQNQILIAVIGYVVIRMFELFAKYLNI